MLHVSEQDRHKGNTSVTVAIFIIITSSRLEDAQSPTLYLTCYMRFPSRWCDMESRGERLETRLMSRLCTHTRQLAIDEQR